MNYVREYWQKIQSGEIVVCEKIRTQMENLIDMMDYPEDYTPYVFDEDVGTTPIDFIETFCRHSKGKYAGTVIELDLWQKAIIQATYGFINKDTGFRKYNEVFTVVGRKNGKSTLMSGLSLYHLVADGESGAEIYALGVKKDQSRLVFSEMCNMVTQSDLLSNEIHKRKSDLYFEKTFSKSQPLASDSNSLDGLNVSFAVMDKICPLYW